MSPTSAEMVTLSFEMAAQRCEDLTPLVYDRLFREQPQMRELFVLDNDNSVRGSMLEWAINSILDLADGGGFGRNLIQTEAVNHSRNGVSVAQFPIFFHCLAATMRELLAGDWSPAMHSAWHELLVELDTTVATAGS